MGGLRAGETGAGWIAQGPAGRILNPKGWPRVPGGGEGGQWGSGAEAGSGAEFRGEGFWGKKEKGVASPFRTKKEFPSPLWA